MSDLAPDFEHAGIGDILAYTWAQAIPGTKGQLLPRSHSSGAYVNGMPVKSGPGVLLGFSGYSSSASAQFIQVFAGFAAPATGDVPAIVVRVAATTDFSGDYGFWGRPFSRGLWIGNSSTGPTYTAGAADTWFDVQYI